MKILYIVLGDLNRVDSGSGVRPNCMFNALLERNHEVYVLSGSQNLNMRKLRREQIKKAKEWVRSNKPDLCYIESSTYPIIHHCDYSMLRFLKRNGVPTSYFYRDIYRIIPNVVQKKRKGIKNKIKDTFLTLLQRYTDHQLHKIDIVYFPSDRFTDYFSYKRMELLPPAGEVKVNSIGRELTNTCLYVGGVSEFYGFPLLMEAFEILNTEKVKYKLILVCREAEFKNICKIDPLPQWLEVHHVSGKDLEPLYEKSDIGLLALGDNVYSNLCIGIKLFQYIGYGLPVLSTKVYTMGKLINENGFGMTCDYDAKSYANAIEDMLKSRENLDKYRKTMLKNMDDRHLWVHRVDKIVSDLVPDNK